MGPPGPGLVASRKPGYPEMALAGLECGAVTRDTDKLTIRCPDCGADLTVDASTGEILFHKKAKQPLAGGKDFDSLLKGLDEDKARAEDLFAKEVAAFKDRDRLLEEKFKEALRRAEEEPDEDPGPRPFDLD